MSNKRERDQQVAELESKVAVWETPDFKCEIHPEVVELVGRIAIREATTVISRLSKMRRELEDTQRELQSVKAANYAYFTEVSELHAQLAGHKAALRVLWELRDK